MAFGSLFQFNIGINGVVVGIVFSVYLFVNYLEFQRLDRVSVNKNKVNDLLYVFGVKAVVCQAVIGFGSEQA